MVSRPAAQYAWAALRACVISWRTRASDVDALVATIERCRAEAASWV